MKEGDWGSFFKSDQVSYNAPAAGSLVSLPLHLTQQVLRSWELASTWHSLARLLFKRLKIKWM